MNAPTFQQESSERPGISKLLLEQEKEIKRLRKVNNNYKETICAVLLIMMAIVFVTLVVVRI